MKLNCPPTKTVRPRRGIALLLVMIGLVVCTLLTAGFLSSQGTAIGIARNERDAEAARLLAQTGIDMCYAEIHSNSSWRETLNPGLWLNKFPIGNGTVTVSASSGDGSSKFSNDPTQPAVFQSTAVCNGRSFTLTGTIGPTGAGTVFRGGNFMAGRIAVGTGLLDHAVVDSYNSAIAPYNSAHPGSNAIFGSNSTASGTLTIQLVSVFRGSLIAGPNSLLSSVVNLLNALLSPPSTSAAVEVRTPGSVIPPNFANMTSRGSLSSQFSTSITPGLYDNWSFTPQTRQTMTATLASGTYEVHNLTVGPGATLLVPDGANVILYANNYISINGAITINGSGALTLYVGNGFTVSSGSVNGSGNTSSLVVLGLPNSNNVQISGTSTISGAVYAPDSSVTLSNSSQVFGAMVAHDITLKNTSQFHFDEALKNLRVSNLTNGSASPGDAEYSYRLVNQ